MEVRHVNSLIFRLRQFIWSQAGDKDCETSENDPHKYTAIKGSFTYGKNLIPEYAWYNGNSDHYLTGETIDPSKPTMIAQPLGDIHDPAAKIWPIKVHRGKQIYDSKFEYFLIPKMAGKGGYWTDFNWDQALRLGSAASGLEFSGSYDFAPTEML
jgi:hypothetical protein